jgi:hypothetical protein
MGAQTQHKALSASWAPQGTQCPRHVRKLGKLGPRTSAQRKRKARPQRKARRHVRKLGAPTQRKARPQDGRPNAKQIRNENVHTREH